MLVADSLRGFDSVSHKHLLEHSFPVGTSGGDLLLPELRRSEVQLVFELQRWPRRGQPERLALLGQHQFYGAGKEMKQMEKDTRRHVMTLCCYRQSFSQNPVYHNLEARCVCLLGRCGRENPGAQSLPPP